MTTTPLNNEQLDEIRREHAELRELLGQVHHAVANRLRTVAQVAELLATLSDHIETHFQEEEFGGFFDEVVSQAPRLSERTDALREEHQRLLTLVNQLSDLALQGNGSDDWWEKLERQFHEFSKDLMHHEHKENELLQEAFVEDIGAND